MFDSRDLIREIGQFISNGDLDIQMLLDWPRQIACVEIASMSLQDASVDPMLIH